MRRDKRSALQTEALEHEVDVLSTELNDAKNERDWAKAALISLKRDCAQLRDDIERLTAQRDAAVDIAAKTTVESRITERTTRETVIEDVRDLLAGKKAHANNEERVLIMRVMEWLKEL